ncbi:MAG TPA: helix-turn-helix domain-containing protein [Sphingobium sp.]|nr:helix-turn-helix domain-containing protein [Sphingobium sp.]
MDTRVNPQTALEILELVGNKWTMLVTYRLGDGAMRFSDLKRCAGPISSKMLTQTLRELERFGMVSREVLPTMPPSVEYRLTDLGRSFLKTVSGICDWIGDNHEAVEQARQQEAIAA